jgi:hypothetical protein
VTQSGKCGTEQFLPENINIGKLIMKTTASRTQKCIVAAILLLTFCFLASKVSHAAVVRVVKDTTGWKLLVDGKPYIVKGVCYSPTKVGESPDTATQRDWMIIDDDNDGRKEQGYEQDRADECGQKIESRKNIVEESHLISRVYD